MKEMENVPELMSPLGTSGVQLSLLSINEPPHEDRGLEGPDHLG
jgi:hypothetical protein